MSFPLTGILLAAGRGRRFGGDKLLAPLADGTPMAVQSARNLTPAVERLLCVVRADDRALNERLRAEGFETVACADADEGMAASLKAGVRTGAEGSGWLLALADMPMIRPATCAAVARALKERGGMVAPEYRGRRGHPAGFAPEWRAALLALGGDQGARPLFQRHPEALHRLVVEDPGVVFDVDTPEALRGVSFAP